MQKTEEQVKIFRALADPTRLEMVKLLSRQRGPDALCVNMLAQAVGVSQSAVSQHLRLLKSVGLVKGERRGYHVHYSIDEKTLNRYRNDLLLLLTRPETTGGQQGGKKCATSDKF